MRRLVRVHPLFDVRLRQAFPDQGVRDRFVIAHLKHLLDEFADHFDDLPDTKAGPAWRRTFGMADDFGLAFVVTARQVADDVVELRSIAVAPLP
ncbi:MAG: hypothetical protein AAGD35_18285 [Actinomycetota bacterium]